MNIALELLHQGLQKPDQELLDRLYKEVLPEIIRAVSAEGGSSADGKVFFKTALVDLAALPSVDVLPSDIDVTDLLKSLAVLHYFDWRNSNQASPVLPAQEYLPGIADAFPEDTRKVARTNIFVWKKLEKWKSLPQPIFFWVLGVV